MKIERILSESDLLPQRVQQTSRRKEEGVLTEDAVSFEGREQRRENGNGQYSAYSPRKKIIIVEQEPESKDDVDVTA